MCLESHPRQRLNVQESRVFFSLRLKTIYGLDKRVISIEEVRSAAKCWSSLAALSVEKSIQTKTTSRHVPLVLPRPGHGTLGSLGWEVGGAGLAWPGLACTYIVAVTEVVAVVQSEDGGRHLVVFGRDTVHIHIVEIFQQETPGEDRLD